VAIRASKYLRRYGIDSQVVRLGGGPINLRIPNDQFRERITRIKFLCRDNSFICGESFFKDIHNGRMKNQDWQSLFVVLTTSPVERENRVLGERYNIAVIHTTELPELANTLVQIKDKATPTYQGSSSVLAAALEPVE
jgi:hypothetical protein